MAGRVNHSCAPNCRAEEWIVDGYIRLWFFTNREISKEEEITFDYMHEFKEVDEAWLKECECGSRSCRKPKFKTEYQTHTKSFANKSNLRKARPPIKPNRAPVRNTSGHRTKVKNETKPIKNIYCFCQSSEDGYMIGCDEEKCEYQWFHFSCVGLHMAPASNKWYCPKCEDDYLHIQNSRT